MEYTWNKSEFIVDYFEDIEGREIDTQWFNLEFFKIKLIHGVLATEGNSATEKEIFLLTTSTLPNIELNSKLSRGEIEDIWNMNDALTYLEENLRNPLSKGIIKTYNRILIPNHKKFLSGKLRSTNVQISNTNYRPPDFQHLPRIVENFEQEIELVKGNINKAFSVLLFIAKNQLFIDGNKRTAILSAMHHLANTNQPLLLLFREDTVRFLESLKDFYETGNNLEISTRLYTHLDINH